MRMGLIIVMGIFFSLSAYAEEKNDDYNAWQFEITPYLFAAGMV